MLVQLLADKVQASSTDCLMAFCLSKAMALCQAGSTTCDAWGSHSPNPAAAAAAAQVKEVVGGTVDQVRETASQEAGRVSGEHGEPLGEEGEVSA